MMFFKILFVLYVLFGLTYWLLQLLLTLRVIKSVPLLRKLKDTTLKEWPKVSIIVPACNEAGAIEQAMQCRLQDDYPYMEILLIDDRSTDRTPEIIDRIAAENRRVKAIHIKELPEGWLGKPYAMHRAVKQATGDWFLFSDADVYIKPGTLKRVIAYCESRKLDHLAVFPQIYSTNFFLDTLVAVFIRMLCMMGKVWAVENEKSDASAGAGAFNLVRRAAFEKTKGFEWLKLEVADDVALAQMLKKSGARSSLVNGRGHVGVYLYRSLSEAAIGSERAIFTAMGNFSLTRLVLIAVILFGLEMAPFFAVIPMDIPYLPLLGLVMIVVTLGISVAVNKWMNAALLPSLFLPVGITIMTFFIVRAGILGVKRGGIYWRETFYPTKILKQGKRFKF